MKKATIYFVLLILFLTGCNNNRMIDGNSEVGWIDWIDFIKVKGITYVAEYDQTGLEIDKLEIGKEYADVKYRLSDIVHNPDYKIQNGDAAFLDIGTKIYKLHGYSPNFRLVAYDNEKIKIYDADYNIYADKGEDILDIREKVENIDVDMEDEDEKGTTKAYIIDDSDKVKKLVEYIMNSPIDYNMQYTGGDQYFLCFNLVDSTKVRKCYFINDNFLNPGIALPEEFKVEFLNSIK